MKPKVKLVKQMCVCKYLRVIKLCTCNCVGKMVTIKNNFQCRVGKWMDLSGGPVR